MRVRAVPITLRPSALVETGRASYGDVVHQLPRAGGVRECLVARPGMVFCSCDYSGLELVTHAQSCLWLVGYSRLAEALNRGVKVHDALAATFLGISYEEFAAGLKGARGPAIAKLYKNIRQAVKPANFGFPGGMSAPKMVLTQRKQGPDTTGPDGHAYKGLRFCVLLGAERCGAEIIHEWSAPGRRGAPRPIAPSCRACIDVSHDIRQKWLLQWPENNDYFALIQGIIDQGQLVRRGGREFRLLPAQIAQHRSNRLRGGTDYCSAANGFFQGLAGDGAKRALTRASRECYDSSYRLPDGSRSPLYGCRVILFAHDELIVEGPEETAHLWGPRISVIMVESMREYTPDVAVEAPPALMKKWYKSAEPVYVDGKLVPWEPANK